MVFIFIYEGARSRDTGHEAHWKAGKQAVTAQMRASGPLDQVPDSLTPALTVSTHISTWHSEIIIKHMI